MERNKELEKDCKEPKGWNNLGKHALLLVPDRTGKNLPLRLIIFPGLAQNDKQRDTDSQVTRAFISSISGTCGFKLHPREGAVKPQQKGQRNVRTGVSTPSHAAGQIAFRMPAEDRKCYR